jgi:hypothetical protein
MGLQMIVEGLLFEHVAGLEPVQDASGSIITVMPQSRYANVRSLALHNYGGGPFCKFTIPSGYRKSGVYLLIAGTTILYIGECANLTARFNAGYGNISPKNCFKGGQETNCRLNNLIYESAMSGQRLSLVFHETEHYKTVEVSLRARLKASWNRV